MFPCFFCELRFRNAAVTLHSQIEASVTLIEFEQNIPLSAMIAASYSSQHLIIQS